MGFKAQYNFQQNLVFDLMEEGVPVEIQDIGFGYFSEEEASMASLQAGLIKECLWKVKLLKR